MDVSMPSRSDHQSDEGRSRFRGEEEQSFECQEGEEDRLARVYAAIAGTTRAVKFDHRGEYISFADLESVLEGMGEPDHRATCASLVARKWLAYGKDMANRCVLRLVRPDDWDSSVKSVPVAPPPDAPGSRFLRVKRQEPSPRSRPVGKKPSRPSPPEPEPDLTSPAPAPIPICLTQAERMFWEAVAAEAGSQPAGTWSLAATRPFILGRLRAQAFLPPAVFDLARERFLAVGLLRPAGPTHLLTANPRDVPLVALAERPLALITRARDRRFQAVDQAAQPWLAAGDRIPSAGIRAFVAEVAAAWGEPPEQVLAALVRTTDAPPAYATPFDGSRFLRLHDGLYAFLSALAPVDLVVTDQPFDTVVASDSFRAKFLAGRVSWRGQASVR